MLSRLGIDRDAIERERTQMSRIGIGGTASRSLLGSLNDFAFLARAGLIVHRDQPLLDMALELAETPVMPLGGKHPSGMTREILGTPRTKAVVRSWFS